MSTSLQLDQLTLSDEKKSRNINYIDPTATNAQLIAFANGIDSLTTNTLVDAKRIETTSLIENPKTPRNMQFKYGNNVITTISAATLGGTDNYTTFYVTFDGGQPSDKIFICYYKASEQYGDLYFNWWDVPKTSAGVSSWEIDIAKGDAADDDYTGTLIIYMPETDTYAAETLEITVTN